MNSAWNKLPGKLVAKLGKNYVFKNKSSAYFSKFVKNLKRICLYYTITSGTESIKVEIADAVNKKEEYIVINTQFMESPHRYLRLIFDAVKIIKYLYVYSILS